ncbi:hypothetical protein GDO78_022593 [Eleutherodactylus coqui]|uniref:C-type lectin domain-containing protein n=1 Tax=Eleutherodactylus coqui TaxID=57060 RepID=A0A8J6E4V3_ELECQ|nr:hypothetical protein GDO78_022593 [Eleutherodactylus coqui]
MDITINTGAAMGATITTGATMRAISTTGDTNRDRITTGATNGVCYADYKHPCYKIAYFQDVTARVGYHQARQVCDGEGGHLLSIESEAEQKLIERMLQNLTNSGSGKADGDFWIGLSRNRDSMVSSGACPDLYNWDDGSNTQYRNWYADEPSCGSESCVVMYHQPTANPGIGGPYLYQWNDDRCNMRHNFICKYPPGR